MDFVERVARRLKLSDLHLLREVVQRGAMAKAAQHLNLTQPAVSKAIAQMEHLLGVRLLDRSRYGATPTIYGEAVLKGGLAAFGEIQNAVAHVQHLSNPNSGALSIGTTQPLALGFIPTVIERVRRSYPGIQFRIVEGNQRTHLRQRHIELAFTRLTNEPEPDIDGEVLFSDPLFVGGHTSHPKLRARKLTLRQIYDGPWSIPDYDSHVGELILQAFQAEGLDPPSPAVTSYSMHLHVEMAARGPYLTIIPKSALRLNAQALSIRPLRVPFRHSRSPVGFLKLRNRSLSPQAELFITHAREVARSLERHSL